MTTPGGSFRDSNPMSADNSFSINSKIMIVAVVVLFGVVAFILGLHIYAKWFWRHGGQHGGSSGVRWRRRRRLEFAADWPGHQRTTHVGLEKSVVDELPTFTFNGEKASSLSNEGPLECAVCLEEFAEGEKGRLLPKCNHSFHIDCIDMWFHSHSTCPLCRCSVAPEPPPAVLQSLVPPQSNDGVGAHPPTGDVVIQMSDSIPSGDSHFDTRYERAQASSAATAAVEHGQEFTSPDSSAAGAGGAGLLSPRQQPQDSRPYSPPSSRRPSMGLSPKPPGIQYPANVLFWGNQTQMNAAGAGAVAGGPREESAGRRRFSSSRVHAPNSLVIEIPRALTLSVHLLSNASTDEPHRASDAQGGAVGGGPRSPIGRLVSSSFRRLMSIRRGPSSPGPEGTCTSFDCEQQLGSTISSSAGTIAFQGSRAS